MRWHVISDTQLYRDEWLNIRLADVQLPDGSHLSHRIIRIPDYGGAVVLDQQRSVLLLWRHRFITDAWAWEIPGGKVEPGEQPIKAAAREFEEETGWRPAALRPLLYIQPHNGISDAAHHIFHADAATRIGPPTERWEAERIAWIPLAAVPELISKREIVSGVTMAALLYTLAHG